MQEAGRKGGQKLARERDVDFFRSIGRKGGEKVAQVHGSDFYGEIETKNNLPQAQRGSIKEEC